MKNRFLINAIRVIAGGLVLLSTSVRGAIEYDAASDFSIHNGNPNGVWSYGWRPTGTSQFNLFENAKFADGVEQWNSGPHFPGLGLYCSYLFEMWSSTTAYSILRWTAPSDIPSVNVSVAQYVGNIPPTGIYIELNGQNVGAALFSAPRDRIGELDDYYGTFFNVKKGDTIDFVYLSGSYHTCTHADIRLIAIPEPASYLAGLGLLSLMLARCRPINKAPHNSRAQ